jgi:hypothetical protein
MMRERGFAGALWHLRFSGEGVRHRIQHRWDVIQAPQKGEIKGRESNQRPDTASDKYETVTIAPGR